MDNNQKIDKFDKIINHYQTIAWQVTALFITSTAVLMAIPINPPSFFLYFFGLCISISAVFFHISFRRRQHIYICARNEILSKMKDEKIELIINHCFNKYKLNQWISYLILFSFITSYWLYKIFWWINNSYIHIADGKNIIIKGIIFFVCILISGWLFTIFG